MSHAKFVYIKSDSDFDNVNKILSENTKNGFTTIVLCPLQYAEIFLSLPIDLAINVGSMQEMEEKTLDYWKAYLDNSNISYFYSFNYFAQPLSNLAQSTNVFSPRLSRHWEIISNKISDDFPVMKLHSPHIFASILAKNIKTLKTNNEEMEAREKYWKNIANSHMNVKSFLEAMDILHFVQDAKIGFNILQHCLNNDLGYIPKEALYLVRWLILEADENQFLYSKLNLLKSINGQLTEIYNRAPKGLP